MTLSLASCPLARPLTVVPPRRSSPFVAVIASGKGLPFNQVSEAMTCYWFAVFARGDLRDGYARTCPAGEAQISDFC